MKKHGFTKKERLCKQSDFKRIMSQGRLFFNAYLKVRVCPSAYRYNRWAVVLGGHYGNAVLRNKIKRRVKEIIRTHKGTFKTAFDIVVFPKNEARDMDYWRLKEVFFELTGKAGLMI